MKWKRKIIRKDKLQVCCCELWIDGWGRFCLIVIHSTSYFYVTCWQFHLFSVVSWTCQFYCDAENNVKLFSVLVLRMLVPGFQTDLVIAPSSIDVFAAALLCTALAQLWSTETAVKFSSEIKVAILHKWNIFLAFNIIYSSSQPWGDFWQFPQVPCNIPSFPILYTLSAYLWAWSWARLSTSTQVTDYASNITLHCSVLIFLVSHYAEGLTRLHSMKCN